ncbi:glycine hydroxymethyltransferase [Rhabdochlamydiaceae symbiont of Dictyostelium giganteum]|uniref:glycine hydroxymethyltransferase n=1 Tax=Rhabdochlamydiaceae symbiont of Dictyostelium giganteum TaxID=3342349 RepID=UPI00384F6E87
MTPYLQNYFSKVPESKRTSEGISYAAALDTIQKTSPEIAQLIVQELKDQRSHLKLIASENFCSLPVQMAMGNLLTDKYAEGFPFHRFYAGCDNVDSIEQIATDELKKLFGCDHAYVQPHSGADANLVAFWSILVHRIQTPEIARLGKKTVDEMTPDEYEKMRQIMMSQKVMGMSLRSGGHLTHGFRHNLSSKMMQSVSYDVDPVTGLIDYKALQKLVKEEKPAILIGGYSAYPRLIDFAILREIADSVGSTLMVDMAHFAGLVAGHVCTGNYNPIPFAHVVTSTTHKTLRGPRGGLILCQKTYKEVIDKGCPLVLGGPLPHVMAAKALAFKEASTPEFSLYANQIVKNAKTLAEELLKENITVTTGGTDNHLLIFDVKKSFGLTGRQAETALREGHVTVNRNMVPFDEAGPWYTSGIRIGPAAMTTLGMKEPEMKQIASWIVKILKHATPDRDPKTGSMSLAKVTVMPHVLHTVQKEMQELLKSFPLYPEVIVD